MDMKDISQWDLRQNTDNFVVIEQLYTFMYIYSLFFENLGGISLNLIH